jgi:hypothetical protein
VRKSKQLSGLVIAMAVIVGGAAGCSDDGPTAGDTPVISQLRVDGALRVSGDIGLVAFRFDYADPDRDISGFVFTQEGQVAASNPLNDATQASGTVNVQQAISLPAAGTEVPFTVFVVDRRGNRSNELIGSFVAPD